MTLARFEDWAIKYAAPAAFALYLLLSPQAAKVAWATPANGLQFEPLFAAGDSRYGLPAGMLSRVAYQESRYNPMAVSPAGAIGLMQFMPATADDLNIDPYSPEQSIDGAGRYLSWIYRQTGNWPEALAAYNWGIGNVQRRGMSEAPAETRNYVADITKDLGLV